MKSSSQQDRPVGLKTLAQRLNVSTTTVSKALRDKPGISREMTERVKSLARELNYTPNLAGRLLKGGTSDTVGMLMTLDLTNPWCSHLISRLETELANRGKTMVLSIGKNDPDKERRCIECLGEGRVSGIIAGPIFRQHHWENLRSMIRKNLPVVFYNCMETLPVNYVAVDLAAGGEIATNYLIEKGHRKIGFLSCPHWRDEEFGGTRREGFERALTAHKLPLFGHFITPGPSTIQAGYERMDELLRNYDKEELPTAFFCLNDSVAIGAMHAIFKHGFRCPEDFSLIGFDNLPQPTTVCTPLTTLDGMLEELSQGLVEVVLEKIANPAGELSRRMITPRLVERQSVAQL
jgi:LacI family transcriptional regulator